MAFQATFQRVLGNAKRGRDPVAVAGMHVKQSAPGMSA